MIKYTAVEVLLNMVQNEEFREESCAVVILDDFCTGCVCLAMYCLTKGMHYYV